MHGPDDAVLPHKPAIVRASICITSSMVHAAAPKVEHDRCTLAALILTLTELVAYPA